MKGANMRKHRVPTAFSETELAIVRAAARAVNRPICNYLRHAALTLAQMQSEQPTTGQEAQS